MACIHQGIEAAYTRQMPFQVRFRAILPLGGAEGRILCLHPFRWGKLTLVPCQTWEQRHAESFVRLSARPVGGLQSLPSMSTRAPSLSGQSHRMSISLANRSE